MTVDPLRFDVMCGRFVSATSPEDLADYFGAILDDGTATRIEPSYNVAPTAEVWVVRASDDHRRIEAMRWGLVPFWAEDPRIGARMINARAETVVDKPAFRRPFARRRCLVPADGFYEWSTIEGMKIKQPWFIRRRDHEPLALAGIWERWRPGSDPDRNEAGSEATEPLETFSILTCSPNATMAPIHNRMPVLMANRHWDYWLDPASDISELRTLLVPAPDDLLSAVPVSTEVNRASNNSPDLIEAAPPLAAATLPGLEPGDRS